MANNIDVGDYVRHKNPVINGGLQMSVEDIRENSKGESEFKCSHFEKDGKHETSWFNEKDIILNKQAEGGFFQG